jgi:hypothetical protein
MMELLFEGWAQPHATSMATASRVAFRVDLGGAGVVIETKARASDVFKPVMIRDMYAQLS